jgi:hypothetical protein
MIAVERLINELAGNITAEPRHQLGPEHFVAETKVTGRLLECIDQEQPQPKPGHAQEIEIRA